jgi:hypothetical protein
MAPPLFQVSFPHGVAQVFAAALRRVVEGRGVLQEGVGVAEVLQMANNKSRM